MPARRHRRSVPGGFGGLADVAVRGEDEEPLERPGEPPVMRDREHRALVGLQALLQRLGAGQVQVVGRLVEEQQRRAGQLEQQDLQPGLLAAGQGAERLPGARLQLVPGERGHRLVDQQRVLGHQDLDRGTSGQVRPGVGLSEEARHHPGAQPPLPLVRHLLRGDLPPALLAGLAIAGLFSTTLARNNGLALLIIWLIWLLVVLRLLYKVWEWLDDYFVVTSKRMMLATGVFSKSGAMLPLIDGGLRRAQLRRSWSQYAQMRDNYRATVLAAFQEVEDGLSLTQRLATEATQQREASDQAAQALSISTMLYDDGLDNYLSVSVAQVQALAAQTAEVQVRVRQMQAAVSLIRALGGGWTERALPNEKQTLQFGAVDGYGASAKE